MGIRDEQDDRGGLSGYEPIELSEGVKSPVDLSKINPTEITTTFKRPYEDILKAKEDYAQALEDRFKKPNWWKIMAGFAKPQLGGFAASLGTVGQTLGEFEAQRRSVAPTIARIRAETAQQRLGLEQGIEGSNIQGKAYGEGRLPTASETLRSSSLVSGPAVAQTAAQRAFESQYQAALQDLQSKMNIEELRRKYPANVIQALLERNYIPKPSDFGAPPIRKPSSSAIAITPEEQNAALNQPSSAKADSKNNPSDFEPGVPFEMFRQRSHNFAVTDDQQNEWVKEQAKAAAEERDNNIKFLGQQKDANSKIFNDARVAYSALSDASLSPLFAIGEGPNIGDLILKAMDGTPVANLVSQAIKQGRPLNDAQKAKLESAINAGKKAIGTFLAGNNFVNPTDRMREAENVIPNLRTAPQETILRAFATMASDALYKKQMYPAFQNYIKTPGNDARNWQSSDEIERLKNQTFKRNSSISEDPIKRRTKDGRFYFATPNFFSDKISEENGPKTKGNITAESIRSRARQLLGEQ